VYMYRSPLLLFPPLVFHQAMIYRQSVHREVRAWREPLTGIVFSIFLSKLYLHMDMLTDLPTFDVI
jgi:hypothetical protein